MAPRAIRGRGDPERERRCSSLIHAPTIHCWVRGMSAENQTADAVERRQEVVHPGVPAECLPEIKLSNCSGVRGLDPDQENHPTGGSCTDDMESAAGGAARAQQGLSAWSAPGRAARLDRRLDRAWCLRGARTWRSGEVTRGRRCRTGGGWCFGTGATARAALQLCDASHRESESPRDVCRESKPRMLSSNAKKSTGCDSRSAPRGCSRGMSAGNQTVEPLRGARSGSGPGELSDRIIRPVVHAPMTWDRRPAAPPERSNGVRATPGPSPARLRQSSWSRAA
jgi:hypothetical protein